MSILDHFHFSDVISPCRVPQYTRDLPAKLEGLIKQGNIDLESRLVTFVSTLTSFRNLSEFKLKLNMAQLRQGLEIKYHEYARQGKYLVFCG